MSSGDLIRSKPILLTYLLLTLSAILFSRTPLFNYLGYEYSGAIGLLAGIAIGLSTVALLRKGLKHESQPSAREFQKILRDITAVSLLTLVIPLVVISVNALFVKNCSFVEGLGFFFLIPVVSVVYGVALGTFCVVMFRRCFLWFILITLITLLHPVYLGYFGPQLYSYNVFYGYFPGLTYDETLTVSWSLAVFRLATLILSGILFVVSMTVVQHARPDSSLVNKFLSLKHLYLHGARSGFVLVGFVLLALFALGREKLQIETSEAYVREKLGSVIKTRHFRIYYDRRSVDEIRMSWIAAEHEFRLQQIARFLKVRLPETIDSYLYPTAELKRSLIGAGRTNITKPWQRSMHLNAESVEQILKHELVHLLAADFGIPVAGLSVSPGLMEGLAMAVEWEWGNRTPHEYAAGMFKFGLVSDVSTVEPILTFGGFVQRPSTMSYVLSGSFIRYLIDRYGIEKFKRAYAWGNLNKVYGRTQERLIREWSQFLTRIEVQEESSDAIQYLFLRPSIFQKVCARVLANINREAWDSYRKEDYGYAVQLFQRSYALISNPGAIIGLVRSHYRAGDWNRVEKVASSALNDTLLAPSLVPLRLSLGDAYWVSDLYERAEDQYARLLRMNLSDFFNEAAQVRLLALEDQELRTALREVFLTDVPDSVRTDMLDQLRKIHPHSHLIAFLMGRVLYHDGEFNRSQEVLTQIPGPLPRPYVEYLSAYTQGLNLYYLGRFQEAKIHFWDSLNYSVSSHHHNIVDDWIVRCDWMSEFAPSYLDSQ